MNIYNVKRCPNCGAKSANFSSMESDKILKIEDPVRLSENVSESEIIVSCSICGFRCSLLDALSSEFIIKPNFKVFISLPMRGLTLQQVKYNHLIAKMRISNILLKNKDGKIIDPDYLYFFDNIQEDLDPETSRSLDYLSNDVKMLGDADLVYFVSGWEKSRGCNIEYQICKDWDIPMIFEGAGIFESRRI